ncbi:Beta-barrel assembly machine subunit BamE [Modicisalibacter xianhensis]|uniref:Outer membrane protein assembly factor BamE n=1 Tax=Modicisalibacter xianhensis TaxID=442341 RepID=A0A4R8FL77_9GAMM|nr:outer membrane protein assembly factor BamE [Halomonas xianhensis]TDX24668.1 Beta-barrel assembly machine subunit BamE [Halomonas xianhensis]
MQNLIKTVTFTLALTMVSGCSYFGVYKRDLPQGNLVTQDMVSQLQPGMSREQVQYVMGSPLLPAPFDANQWDYVYRLDEAYGDVKQRRVTLTFDGNQLVDIETYGDMQADMNLSSDTDIGPVMDEGGPATPAMPQSVPTTGEDPL